MIKVFKLMLLFMAIISVGCSTLKPEHFNFTGISSDKNYILIMNRYGWVGVYKTIQEGEQCCDLGYPVNISGEVYWRITAGYKIFRNDIYFSEKGESLSFKDLGNIDVEYIWNWRINSVNLWMKNKDGSTEKITFYKSKKLMPYENIR